MVAPSLIILGPQGSGKTTQAKLLSKRFSFTLIGAGDVLREIAQNDTEFGSTVRQTINVEGRLVQPELISELMEGKIATVPRDKGLILDGYPRTLTQYELFRQFWPRTGRGTYRIVFIEISDEEAVRRLVRRVTCENCGAVYSQDASGKCVNCGGRLLTRPDDRLQTIQTRLALFYSETMPVIRAMEAEGKVVRVDGSLPVELVHRNIITKLMQTGEAAFSLPDGDGQVE
jgi:adenylate kinase